MKTKIILASALIALSGTVMAQSTKNQSVSVFGNYVKPSGGDGVGSIFGSYGFMPTENLELGVSAGASFSEGETSSHVGVNAKYFFGAIGRAGALVPYLKANVDRGEGTTIYGGGVGAEYGLSESASLFAEALLMKSSGSGSDKLSMVLVGITFRF